MIRAIIAEDERVIREDLRAMLEATGKVTIVAEAANGTECMRLLPSTPADALLLDIRMPGASGLEVARRAQKLPQPPVIAFITAYREYSVEAFEVEAIDYLLKPFDEAQLGRLVDRLEKVVSHRKNGAQTVLERLDRLQAQLDHTAASAGAPIKIPVKDYKERTIRLVAPSEILYVRREGDRTHIRTKNADYPTYYTVDQLEQRLTPLGFLRANSGTLVNTRLIDHVIPNGDRSYDLILIDRSVHTVSRRRSKALLPLLKLD